MNPHELAHFFLSLGILLGAARLLGELASRFSQPAVVGEILAGLILGPTVLGALAPGASEFFLPESGARAVAMDAYFQLSIALFLLAAGLEVDLSSLWKQGRAALSVSFAGSAFPFVVGLAGAWWFPGALGRSEGADPVVFALFFATALSITALPVIAKTLMDLNLYRSDVGVLVVAAATFNDLSGWIVFSVILGMAGAGGDHGGMSVGVRLVLTFGFVAATLTLVRSAFHRALPWIHAHTRWPTGVLGAVLSMAFVGAAAAEFVGIHAVLGAFLVGVAVGDSSRMRQHARRTIEQFVSSVFVPVFFASIGLRVDLFRNLDLPLCLAVTAVASFGKIAGCGLAGLAAGLPRREAAAVGLCMNARGVMEIVLGLLAREAGLIDDRMFVALVFMALATSIFAGPATQWALGRRKGLTLTGAANARTFVARLRSDDREGAIRELAEAAAASADADAGEIARRAVERERTVSTSLGGGVAVPHARVPGLRAPVVAVGISPEGLDFDAPDGLPARLVFLIVAPEEDGGAQLQLLAAVGKLCRNREFVEDAPGATDWREFVGIVKASGGD